MANLKKLTIEALRGSTRCFELAFDSGKPITLIYGENGTGKSTICDALEFLGKGNLGSLEEKGLGSTYPYWHSTGRNPNDMKVTLETTRGVWQATLAKNKMRISPPNDVPTIEVLRRRQILTLMEAKPSDRFEVLRPFIALDAIENAEKTLREQIREEKKASDFAVARMNENSSVIDALWKTVGRPGDSALTWAAVECKRDLSSLLKMITEMIQLRNAFDHTNTQRKRLEEQRKQWNDVVQSLHLAEEAVQQTQSHFHSAAPELIQLLTETQSYLNAQPTPDVCPVCGSRELVDGLSARIHERLSKLQSLQKAVEKQGILQQQMRVKDQQLQLEQTRLVEAAITLLTAMSTATLPDALQDLFDQLDSFAGIYDTSTPLEIRTVFVTEILESLGQFVKQLNETISQAEQTRGSISGLRVALQQYEESLTTQQTNTTAQR